MVCYVWYTRQLRTHQWFAETLTSDIIIQATGLLNIDLMDWNAT